MPTIDIGASQIAVPALQGRTMESFPATSTEYPQRENEFGDGMLRALADARGRRNETTYFPTASAGS